MFSNQNRMKAYKSSRRNLLIGIAFSVSVMVVCPEAVGAQQLSFENQQTEDQFQTVVQPLLDSYCTQCHGSETQKGERRFDQLSGDIPDDNTLVDFQDILDQLNLAEMPPEDANQPAAEERQKVIEWITKRIENFHDQRKSNKSQPVLRRLNSREYRNTVQDLLHVDMTIFDPTTSFPRDQTTEHLDTVGETLVTSGYLLAQYLAAAEAVIDKAMNPTIQPNVQTWRFTTGFVSNRKLTKSIEPPTGSNT